MPNSSSQVHPHKSTQKNRSNTSHKHTSQHGHPHRHNSRFDAHPGTEHSLLLDLPVESLTHITSFLDPTSLFELSSTNRRLHEHVEDDNTWCRAYVLQFLGISPEDNIRDSPSSSVGPKRALMLRREESSWKREFVLRWNLRRRWERTRFPTISHIPVNSSVSSMYLMPSKSVEAPVSPVILTASLQYGIVARSYPITGKILRGYLDAAGTLNGLGIGNPNAEFTPDLVQCALSAEGGTARILWGFRNGTVAVTNAQKALETSRPAAAHWLRSSTADSHEGAVEDAVWVNGTNYTNGIFVTGGADGCVRVWDAKRVTCVWKSTVKAGQLLKDSCVKVAAHASGVVAAIFKSGETAIWSGFGDLSAIISLDTPPIISPQEFRFPPPPVNVTSNPYTDTSSRKITAFHLYCASPTSVSVLTACEGDAYFYKLSVDTSSGHSERIAYGDHSTGAITSLQPVFAARHGDHTFVVVGDQLGSVNVYAWDDIPTSIPPQSTPPTGLPTTIVLPTRKFEAHNNGAVTALAWTPTVIVTGSSRGSIKTFDSLTFAVLRDFTCSSHRCALAPNDAVTQIIVDRDFLAASVANRVIAWRGEPGSKTDKANGKGKRAVKMSNGIAKWHQQVEMYRDIAESRRDLEYEQAHTRRVFGREKAQLSSLESLGLSEVEAVEYVLMLSRDEEEARRRQTVFNLDDGVFSGSFDEDLQTPIATPAGFIESYPATPSHNHRFNGRSNLHIPLSQSPSSSRIQISPRPRPEPMEAGGSPSFGPRSFSSSSSLSSPRTGSDNGQPPSIEDPSQFPSMSSTPTHRSSGSPESYRSAWSTPLRTTRSEGPSSPRGMHSLASSPNVRDTGMSLLAARFAHASLNNPVNPFTMETPAVDEDEELRFAIELSLAEARSRGEDV